MEPITVYGISQMPFDVQKLIFLEKLHIAERELLKCLSAPGVSEEDTIMMKKAAIKLFKIEQKIKKGY